MTGNPAAQTWLGKRYFWGMGGLQPDEEQVCIHVSIQSSLRMLKAVSCPNAFRPGNGLKERPSREMRRLCII